MQRRNLYISIILSLLLFFSGLYLYFPDEKRADIFLFYEYVNKETGVVGRYVVNILNELSDLVTIFTILLLWYVTAYLKSLKRVILPFLIISFLDIVDYVGWYQQNAIYKLPVLVILIIVFNVDFKRMYLKYIRR